jgi:ABC-type transport system involved in multi-copper enzyme maturation permease subunit
LNRELMAASRRVGLWGDRGFVAGAVLAIVLVTFAARYYWDGGHDSPALMTRVASQSFVWIVLLHGFLIMGVGTAGAAPSIAGEKDRRTLDFLLATRLGNAEIVLGKLAACMAVVVAQLAAGLPLVLLLHLLGGVDLRLIALAYVGLSTTAFFLIALGIWVSTRAAGLQQAAGASVLWMIAWLAGPFVVSMVFPRFGIRLPGFLMAMNAWVMASSPFELAFKIGGGATPSGGLLRAVAWMSGLQVAGGALLVIVSIAGLRSAYRRNVSGDSRGLVARLTRPGWRLRPRPPVGDDPILWREMTTSRDGPLMKLVGLAVILGIYGALGYVTDFFGRPALIEVWRHGYGSGIAGAERPDWNIIVRFFVSGTDFNPPVDIARTEFNLFLRFVTTPIIFLVTMVAAGGAAAGIVGERARATWDSLIATPLTAGEILRSELLLGLWRMRWGLVTLLALWTVGLGAGAIHPVGYLVSALVLAAWTWFMLAFGLSIAMKAKDAGATSSSSLGLLFLLTGAGILPFLLPSQSSSVLLGAGSPPFVAWLSLVSYRDVRNAWRFPVYPALQWMHLETGEGALSVAAACLISIIAPAVGGLVLWRFALVHFDRQIGRPFRETPATTRLLAAARIGLSSREATPNSDPPDQAGRATAAVGPVRTAP